MEYLNQTIGKYKLTRFIGEGGMATVYEGVHEKLGTKVAVKILNPILSANQQIRERFMNEAKIMAGFNHPNITKIIDFEETPHYLAIIMELLEGHDLNTFVKSNNVRSDNEIKSLFKQILSAFQYAHENGVIHRDIKPSNIYVLKDGTVKILDFGIAKLFGQGNEMTQTGTQMGTPIFMSPEQVKADKSIDHRSDIYSLGVMLYFLINGKAPYDATTESQFDIFNKIVFEDLPKTNIKSTLLPIVDKACQKDREKRFQTCEEILIYLSDDSNTQIEDNPIKDTQITKEKSTNEISVYKSISNENSTNEFSAFWAFFVLVFGFLLVIIILMFSKS